MPLYHTISEWPDGKLAGRIVSLVPSITELLSDLGLEHEVVGITKFCTHPEAWFQSKQRIGGTKNAAVDKILALKPDLIIANREENVAEQVNALAVETDVWLTDIKNLKDALKMIQDIGFITGKQEEAGYLIAHIKTEFARLPVLNRPLRVGYLIWHKPFMVAGGDTYIHNMLSTIGLVNVFDNLERYPEVSLEILHENSPELILLSSEPYPFGERHMLEIGDLLPGVKPVLVDGTFFSWYGSRLAAAPNYFGKLIMEWNQTF